MAPRNIMSMSVSTASELSHSQFTEQISQQQTPSSPNEEDFEVSINVDAMELDDPTQMSPQAIKAELQYYGLSPTSNDRDELETSLRRAREKHNSNRSGKGGLSPHLEATAAKALDNTNNKRKKEYPPDAISPTHIPLTPNNKIPSQILNIINNSSDTSMKSINLDHKALGNNEVIKLSSALERNITIKHLSLRNCNISDDAILAISNMMCKNFTLTTLHLDDNYITTEGAAEISTALIKNETLTTLTLNDNVDIGEKGLVYLIGALEHNITIRTLDVQNCGYHNGTSYQSLGSGSRSGGGGGSGRNINRMEQLDKLLESRQIDSNFESLLERLLDDDFRVTGIDLSGRKIGNLGVERLSDALADNNQVRQLWLRGCNISNKGAMALASCIEQNMTIVDLFLGNNNIGDEGLIAFSDALAISNQTLVSLELDDNHCTAEGFNAFIRSLEDNTSVLVASFENNKHITESMCEELENKLGEKRNNLNLVSFIVDPNAGDASYNPSQDGPSAAKSGVVNMSVCSSYMPSTYRRAGFASKDGNTKGDTATNTKPSDAHLRQSNSGSYKYSTYNRSNSQQSPGGGPRSGQSGPQSRPPPPPPPPPPHHRQSSGVSEASRSQQSWQRGGGASVKSKNTQGYRTQIPIPIKNQGLDPIQEGNSTHCSSLSSTVGTGKHRVRSVAADNRVLDIIAPQDQHEAEKNSHRSSKSDNDLLRRPSSQPQEIVPVDENQDNNEITPLVQPQEQHLQKPSVTASIRTSVTSATDIGPKSRSRSSQAYSQAHESVTMTAGSSIKHPQTQRNFNTTLKKLWRRVEMMRRTNHFAFNHYKARHFWFWFVPISSSLFLSVVLSLATAIDTSVGSRVGLALFAGFFACIAFGLNFLQSRFGWSSRAEVHRSAEVELSQVAFRLDTLGKYEGQGLSTGSHSTRSRANAVRDLYRIDVYLQAMQRCTPPIPENINEVFYLLSSRLKGICLKYPNAVKVRAFYDDEEPDSDNPVPVDMQIDALDLLGREIESYFLYPLFMPDARDVVSRTIDIFFAEPEEPPLPADGIDDGSYYYDVEEGDRQNQVAQLM